MADWSGALDTIAGMKGEIGEGFLQTLIMLGISVPLSVLAGGVLGVWLFACQNRELFYNRPAGRLLEYVINTVRAFPFIILILYVGPLTKLLLGSTLGPVAAGVGLTVAGAFFFARLAEQNLREVPRGIIEAAVSMGASPWQIIFKVLFSEARAGMVSSITVLTIGLLSYSAAVGMIGGGGIGDLAVRYGYHRYQDELMHFLVLILVVLVNLIQAAGNWMARKLDKR